MVNRNEANFIDVGLRLKAIREDLRITLDTLSKATGMSRTYLSDFERGFRLPTAKYTNYLFHTHQVNLNYVYGGEGPKFRHPAGGPPNFGMFQEEVDRLLHFMAEMPHALYAVLGFFTEYQLTNEALIKRQRAAKETAAADEKK